MFGAINLNIFWLLQTNSIFQESSKFICIVKNFGSAIITVSMSHFSFDTPSIYAANSILKIIIKCIFMSVTRLYVIFINSLPTKNTD